MSCLRCNLARCNVVCVCTVDGVGTVDHEAAGFCADPRGAQFGSGAKPADWDERPRLSLPIAASVQPVLRERWPDWAATVADMREPEDAGVGDTIHRKLGEGGLLFEMTLQAMGVPCGCAARRAEMNVEYGYSL